MFKNITCSIAKVLYTFAFFMMTRSKINRRPCGLHTTSLILICIILGIGSCKIKDPDATKNDLQNIMETDRAFSELSKKHGMKDAFIEYMDSDGVLIRANHHPIVGADAIDFLSQANDSTYSLTWRPSSGEVASSGDLGFTYGIYNLQLKDTLINGTYVSIWKKQKDGKWKFVLDAGNEGLGK